jgi:streptomycin 6-kinase
VTDPAAESAWNTKAPWGITDRVRARLEATAKEVAADWGLELGPQFPMAKYSFAAPIGEDAVLKIPPIEDDLADHEAAALAFWNGDGAVRLLRHDPARRALLIERAQPGTDASTVPEEEAIAAAIAVGKRIWREPPQSHPFRTIRDWVARWLPADEVYELVPVARRIFGSMDIATRVVVHSDFHHYNLLRHGDRWVAIDPKPFVGEPEFDIPAFLWNPIRGARSTRARTEARIRAFADAGLDGDKIRQWAIVRGVCDGLPLTSSGTEGGPQLRIVRELL